MPGKILPAIGNADETGRAREEPSRAADGQCSSAAFGEQHRDTLVVGDPGGVARTAVDQMRSQQYIQAVVCDSAYEWVKLYAL